jgi:hypothetical protein
VVVDREYVLKSAGGGGTTAILQLDYGQSEVPPGTDESQLRLLRGPCVIDTLPEKWNMVSLPLLADDARKDTLFPGASSPAFFYDAAYVVEPTLTLGRGYWLRYPAPRRVQIVGAAVEQDTLDVSAGWNMIGTVSYPLRTSAIVSVPQGIITSRFFDYAGGYRIADSLKPLRGYWVKTSGPGRLILSAAVNNAKASPPFSSMERFNSLVFRDADGNERRLYFGNDGKLDLRQFELPPVPPDGVFDVRFSTQRMLEVAGPSLSRTISILISSAAYPVSVEWAVQDPSVHAVLQVDGRAIPLGIKGGMELSDAGMLPRLLLSSGPVGNIPKEFALRQNHPNPFNPATVIDYQLPVASRVTLRIYNLLGQEVGVLVNGFQDAGFRSVRWDGAGNASGLYFYRIDATSAVDPSRTFTQVKKMLLLR